MTIAHQTQSSKLASQHQIKLQEMREAEREEELEHAIRQQTMLQKMREVERAKELEHAKKLLKIASCKHVLDNIDAM